MSAPRLPVALPYQSHITCECGATKLYVIDSRLSVDGSIYRRRACRQCGARITTQEIRVPSTRRHVPRGTPQVLAVEDAKNPAH